MSMKRIEELEAKLNALKGQPIEEVGEELATTLNDLAYILYRSNPTKTEEYGRQALAVAEKLDDEKIIARSHLIIGIANIVRDNDGLGLEQSLRALSLYERIDDKPGIARCCNYIGYLHSKRGDHGKALEYLFQALELNEELDSKSNIAISYNTIGTIYHRSGDYANALKYLNKALALFEEYGTENNKRNTYLDLGSVYYKQEKYGQALEYFQMALKLAETVDDKQSICICLHNLGDVNLQWKHYDSSLGYLEQSLAIALEIESREMQLLNYEFLSKLYVEQNDHRKALDYYQKYSELKSEVFSEESARKIAQLEIQHEVEKKEQQAEIYRLKNVELEAMVEERTERLAHLNAVLAAVRNVNQLITHEIDRDALLQQACEKLVEARGYFSAWITLLDDNSDIQADFRAGLTNGVGSSLATLKCGLLTLENPGILTVESGDKLCQGCPRAYVEKSGTNVVRMLTGLVYEGNSFGVICVTLSPEMAHDPGEQGLFEELAGDLSFALHHREVDNKRKESDRLYRSLYDSMSEGMSVNELIYERGRAVDYRVVDVNPAFEIIA
ncbi:tetratricopeptide repeat protein, partial [bacterium]|nr:tetratricopeptide repeat protein [bacterium]